jgi:CRP/FNR family transcriptional regulator
MQTSKLKRSMIANRTAGPGEACACSPSGARIHLKRGQHLPLDRLGTGELLRIERGCLILKAATPEGTNRVVLVLFPDDMISREAMPPLPAIGLTAALPATVLRLQREPNETAGKADGQVADAYARLAARAVLHAIALSELTAEQRIATFLIEMALRLGSPTPAGCAFELPLSRTDLAHYLALNPDTTSRLMSRLRVRGLLTSPARGWATIPNLATLAAITPLAATLRGLWPAAECGAGLDDARAPAS